MQQLLKYFEVPAASSEVDTETLIKEKINYLIQHDFEKLINILYRADVNENKIRIAIAREKNDAAEIIYTMLEEREMEKKLSRKKYKAENKDDLENEW